MTYHRRIMPNENGGTINAEYICRNCIREKKEKKINKYIIILIEIITTRETSSIPIIVASKNTSNIIMKELETTTKRDRKRERYLIRLV